MQILVVEDERKVAKALKEGLEAERYQVTVAHTGEEGFYLLNSQTFDLVLLDLMLPGRDGFEIVKTLREKGLQTPVLILTARDTVDDRVLGLDSGADDYLVKPFAFPELLARIRALLRRGRIGEVLRLKLADLEMDLVTRKVTRSGGTIELTAREFELLEYLLRNQGHVVSREMLARDVWQPTWPAGIWPRYWSTFPKPIWCWIISTWLSGLTRSYHCCDGSYIVRPPRCTRPC